MTTPVFAALQIPENIPVWAWLASGIPIALLGWFGNRATTKSQGKIAAGTLQQAFLDQLMARIEQMERQLSARDEELEGARARMVILGQEVDECNRDRHDLRAMIERVEEELRVMRATFIGYKRPEEA